MNRYFFNKLYSFLRLFRWDVKDFICLAILMNWLKRHSDLILMYVLQFRYMYFPLNCSLGYQGKIPISTRKKIFRKRKWLSQFTSHIVEVCYRCCPLALVQIPTSCDSWFLTRWKTPLVHWKNSLVKPTR